MVSRTTDPGFLAIARLIRPQGRRGEMAAEILTDVPRRFDQLRSAFLEQPGAEPRSVSVENAWPHKGRVILKLAGIDSIDEANLLRGRLVLLPRSERAALATHQYYIWELQGCRVVRDLDGVTMEIGIVTEVEPTEGVPLLHVAPIGAQAKDTSDLDPREHARPSDELLIPLAQAICERIDIDAKLIVIDPPEDLLELNR
ncbi:MAG TPA: ribosome maturation factor RimM [Terriglobia bacterium]|nr:ribosome maturation factor RimM [Terriglobia bacterium]